MRSDPQLLISRYFDEDLTDDEFCELQDWLMSSPDHAQTFALAALLHDRLHGEFAAISLETVLVAPLARKSFARRRLFIAGVIGVVVVGMLVLAPMWWTSNKTSASAATELNRLIAAQEIDLDRTYAITVEEAVLAPNRRDAQEHERRPPKAPMDNAILHVRKGQQFVLIRQTREGRPFITGCNGRVSWMVRADGPVRFSTDLTRFHRDIPGHENGTPLFQIEQNLEQLKRAYDVQLLPIENNDDAKDKEAVPTRLLIAIKKRGFLGAKRIEISYGVKDGLIREMRFVSMPYGPEKLTLKLTLIDERNLGPNFFDHDSHHALNCTVKEE